MLQQFHNYIITSLHIAHCIRACTDFSLTISDVSNANNTQVHIFHSGVSLDDDFIPRKRAQIQEIDTIIRFQLRCWSIDTPQTFGACSWLLRRFIYVSEFDEMRTITVRKVKSSAFVYSNMIMWWFLFTFYVSTSNQNILKECLLSSATDYYQAENLNFVCHLHAYSFQFMF